MRIRFRERPDDLFAVAAMCILALSVIAGTGEGPLRFALALLFVLFLPGYAITATVFPRGGEMDWIERIGLSVGISLAVVPLLGLVLSVTPPGVRIEPIVAALLLVTLGMIVVAYEQRMGLLQEDRLSLSIDIDVPRWRELPIVDRALALGVAAALVLGAGGLAYAITTSPPGLAYTELYLLDSNHGITSYPSRLNVSQPAFVFLGIANHERREMNYTVEVRLVSVHYVYNSSTKRNDTVEDSYITRDLFPVNLTDGGLWEGRYDFSIPTPGDYVLRFLLSIPPPQAQPYRLVQRPIHVT